MVYRAPRSGEDFGSKHKFSIMEYSVDACVRSLFVLLKRKVVHCRANC
jgi:hypothetical protein